MSFHSTFSTALLASIASLTSIASEDVYLGERARDVKKVGTPEAWVEYRGQESVGRGSGDGSKLHNYTIHLLLRDQQNAAHTWAAHHATLEALAELLVDAYDGSCPFVSTVSTVVQAKCSQGEADPPDDFRQALEIPVLLEVHEA